MNDYMQISSRCPHPKLLVDINDRSLKEEVYKNESVYFLLPDSLSINFIPMGEEGCLRTLAPKDSTTIRVESLKRKRGCRSGFAWEVIRGVRRPRDVSYCACYPGCSEMGRGVDDGTV